ncbi:MAG: hypothetical protein HMLIMOIP_000126 [Candidatus Nitrosomirales archaeon]|jgi:hypothetical protein
MLMSANLFIITGISLFSQRVEAQTLQLRVSAAERLGFENHFFGSQIVQIIVDDPGATDPDESTVGLVINGFNSFKVHLSDGLWYTYFAEDQGFSILADILSDGVRDSVIVVSKAFNDAPSPSIIGGTSYTILTATTAPLLAPDSFIAEIEVVGGFPFVELNQIDIFPTLPPPFFEEQLPAANVINADLRIGAAEGDGDCTVGDGGLSTGIGTEGDPDCDWPYIRLIGLEETSTVEIRAGSESVTLIFDDFADSIVSSIDRENKYPLRAEVITSFTDFMWNINPVEEDSVFFVLDRVTGNPNRILYQPVPNFDPAGDGQNFPDLFPVFTSSPGMEFDERQVLELDQEGVSVLAFANAFSQTGNTLVTFVQEPFARIFENARRTVVFDAAVNVFNTAGADIGPAVAGDLLPVIPMFEGDPNLAVFDNTLEAAGGRATLFTATKDRVASFDYFDIINSAPMTTHDGFTSVDREIYDSGDRAVFTVTDPDQNLRSKISEEPSGRESASFIRVGNPFPLVNTNPAAGISNTSIDTVTRLWATTFLQAGAGGAALPDATTFGIAGGGAGANVFADADNDNTIDMGFGAGEGTERFHADGTAAGGPDIVEITGANLPAENRQLALVFTPPLIGGSPATSIIVDTTLTLDSINDFLDIQDITGNEILGQVRVDNLFDGTPTADQLENFLVQVAQIRDQTGGILGQTVNTGIVGTTVYDVRMPKYNLVHIDLTDLQTSFNFGKALVKIDTIDPSCISAVVATAFAETCVHASQVVDFQIVETDARDTDALATTGDDVNDPVDEPALPAGGLDSWSSQITDAFEVPVADQETGFDRDPLAQRIGVGAFRPMDLESVALANGGTTNDRIRVTLLLLAGVDASAQAAGFDPDEPVETISAASQRVVVDIGGLGAIFDPAPTDTTPDSIVSPEGHGFSNLVYRLELDEEGSNSSVFSGRADFMTFLQLDTVPDVLNDIVLTGDPLRIWMPNRFIPPNRLSFTNLDEDVVQFFREVSTTFIYETDDGEISWDKEWYRPQARAALTLEDEDLNRKPDAIERYSLPLGGFISIELGKNRIDDACAKTDPTCFLAHVDASLRETGSDTGIFKAQIDMPARLRLADGSIVNTNRDDLEIRYIDIRDRSSVRQEFDATTNVLTAVGTVVLDRSSYPLGVGIPPDSTLLGPVMYINITKGFFTQDPELRDVFDLTRTVDFSNESGKPNDIRDTFEIRIFNGGGVNPIIYSANPANDIRNGGTHFPLLDRNQNEVKQAVESGPNTNLYEFEFMIYCPDAIPTLQPLLSTPICTDIISNVPFFKANSPIEVIFNDPQDDSGTPEDVEAAAVIQPITAQLGSDKPAYRLGEQEIIWIVEPDRNLDSKTIEFIPFNEFFVITDKADELPLDILIFVLNLLGEFITTYTGFVETEPNSGVFAILAPEGVVDEVVIDRGEQAELIFFDSSSSGGGETRVELEIDILEFEPEIRFSKEEYTPFDEVQVSIISTDADSEPNEIDIAQVLVSSSSQSGFLVNVPETGLHTGIFEEDFDLTPNRDMFTGDLIAIREDGISVEFRIDEDTVVTKSVFVNYHIGNVMFDRDQYRTTDRAVVRVIDPDENMNPDTIDTLDARIWSTSDRGGLLVTLRETGDRTGVFEEFVTFTTDEESSGTRLRVLEGDTMTAKYTDRTLPAPAALDNDGVFTVEVEELFASSLIGSTGPPLERAILSEPILVNQDGLQIEQVEVGRQVLIQSEIRNDQNKMQEFAYIVQVKDSNGVTISMSWTSGQLFAKDSILTAQSWIPENVGEYEIEVFVWESVDNPNPLSPVRSIRVSVAPS